MGIGVVGEGVVGGGEGLKEARAGGRRGFVRFCGGRVGRDGQGLGGRYLIRRTKGGVVKGLVWWRMRREWMGWHPQSGSYHLAWACL